ncbi:MAG: energy transducer TonB [Paludibacteraceae bacterium]|nr:energy transducer TonB [Paludibacteraceae bacterium]
MDIKKSKKASLEDKKFTYLLMGLCFVLSVCYVAFEWTEKEVAVYDVINDETFFEEEVDEIENTTQETPPPPPPPEVKAPEEIIIVENDEKVEEINIQSEDSQEDVEIAPPVEEKVEVEVEEDQTVFVIVETMPEFPGGQAELMKYLSNNVKYPVIAQENGIQGRVVCQFVVERDGSIANVEVVRSSNEASLDREAVRVIKSMPKWKPGKQRGKAVRVKYTVPVNFKLQ